MSKVLSLHINFSRFIFILLTLLISCSKQENKTVFISSCPPVAMIVQEIAGKNAEVINILPAGESPHTYSPTPATLKKAERALALFYVSPLLDEWAVELPVENKIKLMDLVKTEHYSYYEDYDGGTKVADPHFFTDPTIVESIVDDIASKMSKLDSRNEQSYKDNALKFKSKLKSLNEKILSRTETIRGKNVVQFHPSFNYYLKKYGLNHFASIEPFPGKEPTPAYLAKLIKSIKQANIKSIFSETELPDAAGKAVAESSGAVLYQLDPLGGTEGKKTYEDYLLFNTNVFLKALK